MRAPPFTNLVPAGRSPRGSAGIPFTLASRARPGGGSGASLQQGHLEQALDRDQTSPRFMPAGWMPILTCGGGGGGGRDSASIECWVIENKHSKEMGA